MSSLMDKLNKTEETKKAISDAIIENGGSISQDTVFSSYPDEIRSISGIKSAYVVQEEAPEDTKLLWIQTSTRILKYYNGSEWLPIFTVWGS